MIALAVGLIRDSISFVLFLLFHRYRFIVSHSILFFCSFKSGKVVIVLSGRYAGRKAVVVRASDEGNKAHKFGHAVGE